MIAMDREHRARLRARLIDGHQRFTAAWSADLVVVAAPEIDDIADSPILTALSPSDSEVLCLTTEDAGDSRPHQAVLASPSEVGDWRWQFAPVDVVIARSDLSAAVLLTVDEFILIGGERTFVEAALGHDIEEARAEFDAYAKSMARAARHLPGIAAQYS